MATQQQEESLALAAQDEMDKIVRKKVVELAGRGETELAAQLLTELARTKLPDGHPSKSLKPSGVLLGEQASQMSRFEQGALMTKESIAFAHALYAGTLPAHFAEGMTTVEQLQQTAKAAALTIEVLSLEILHKHPGLMVSLTKALLEAKRNEGFLPVLPQAIEGEAKNISEDSESANEE